MVRVIVLGAGKLRIGRMSYANLFPIFYMLEKECDCSNYEFIEGVPSDLNKKIREGEIDICPSSSIEYLRYSDKYDLVENHSISSKGPVGSILLFSRRPIETLSGQTVLTSSQSETSVAMLQIILKKFYEAECRFRTSSAGLGDAIKSFPAYMLIGDDAMVEAIKWPKLYIYDIGELWYKNTGLPSVFALWIIKKDCCAENAPVLGRFLKDLDKAKSLALKNLKTIASASTLSNTFPVEELVLYWKGISYDLGDEHKKGFELFRKYAEELGLIKIS